MNIRSLQADDQEEVIGIMAGHPLQFPKFIIEKYPIRWNDFLNSSTENNKSQFYVAFNEDNEIVGHAGYLFNSEVGLYEIVGVAVKKGVQRQGIGKALISAICNSAREMNEKKIILYTLGHVRNEDTITFYRNKGFDQINYEKDFFRSEYHRVTFIKNLVAI
jgi:N-acetylglutamate synthase-like GNAT family acetyltransferase